MYAFSCLNSLCHFLFDWDIYLASSDTIRLYGHNLAPVPLSEVVFNCLGLRSARNGAASHKFGKVIRWAVWHSAGFVLSCSEPRALDLLPVIHNK